MNVVISNGEDKTTKVWDLNRRSCIDTFKREGDRFWIVGVHPETLIFASGADCGIYVFSLMKEKIPIVLVKFRQFSDY